MQKDNQGIKGLNFMILGIVMAVVSVSIIFLFFIWDILPGACFFLLFITIPLVINGIAYFVYNVVGRIKGKDLSNIVGRNIHLLLDDKLKSIQEAMESEMKKYTLNDLRSGMQELLAKEA